MIILFTICGRAGSKGFENKNLKRMNGVPLVYYTLAVIKEYMDTHISDTVIIALNTDSVPLVDIVKKQKKLTIQYVKRKAELAGDITPKIDVIKDTYFTLKQFNPDVVIDLDITSPLRCLADVENILKQYEKGKYDLVCSVVDSRRSPYFNMVEEKKDGYYRKICQSDYTARQQAPKTFELNASIYAYNPLFLNSNINKTLLDYDCGISIMQDYFVLDIDSEKDFKMMELLHSQYIKVDKGLNSVFEDAKKIQEE